MVSTFSKSWPLLLLIIIASTGSSPGAGGEKQDSPSLDALKTVLGKGPESKELMMLRKQLKGDPIIDKFEKSFYYSWKEHGLTFLFERGNVRTIFFYADGADGFQQYRGKLPEGLRFTDVRRDVEKKLGAPEISEGGGVGRVWVVYPKTGVSITYVSKDVNDQASKIHHVTLQAAPKEKG